MLMDSAQPRLVNPYPRILAGLLVVGLVLIHGPLVVTCETVAAGLAGTIRGNTLRLALLGFCSAAGLAVIALIIRSIVSFHAAKEPRSRLTVGAVREFAWALVPAIIVIAAAMPAIRPIVLSGQGQSLQADQAAEYACRPA